MSVSAWMAAGRAEGQSIGVRDSPPPRSGGCAGAAPARPPSPAAGTGGSASRGISGSSPAGSRCKSVAWPQPWRRAIGTATRSEYWGRSPGVRVTSARLGRQETQERARAVRARGALPRPKVGAPAASTAAAFGRVQQDLCLWADSDAEWVQPLVSAAAGRAGGAGLRGHVRHRSHGMPGRGPGGCRRGKTLTASAMYSAGPCVGPVRQCRTRLREGPGGCRRGPTTGRR